MGQIDKSLSFDQVQKDKVQFVAKLKAIKSTEDIFSYLSSYTKLSTLNFKIQAS